MKTTLDLPDDLMRAVKIRAAQQDSRLKDLIASLLRQALALGPVADKSARLRRELPLIECAHKARPDQEMTPERVAATLLAGEAGSFLGSAGSR